MLPDLNQDYRMAMTPKVAVAVLLVASLTAGCGAPAEESAEEKEAACWAKRHAIIAEMQVWVSMDNATVFKTLKVNSRAESHRAKKIAQLEATLPDC